MTKNALKTITGIMSSLQLDYSLIENKKNPIEYPYFVGEYTEVDTNTEDGYQESTFMLTGITRGTWMELESAKEMIEEYIEPEGSSFMMEDGSAVVIIYSGSIPVPSDDPELKKIQMNFTIKEWKV